MKHLGPIVFAVLASAAAAQSSPTGGKILLLDESTRELLAWSDSTLAPIGAPSIDKTRLLPLRLWGRAAADALDASLPQTSDELGTAAIALPDGGWLLKARDSAHGEVVVLHVDRSGAAQPLLALPLVGNLDPLLDGAAVSAVEPRAAVVLDVDRTGRGDVWLLRLDGGGFGSSGAPARCITSSHAAPDPEGTSLCFADGALFFVDDDTRLFRAPTDGSADATRVTIPNSAGQVPAQIGQEIAISRDGSTLAFFAGASEKSSDLYVAKADGSCINLSKAPVEFEEPGFLPQTKLGPMLSLSPDGSRITYGVEIPELELYTRASDGSDSPVHLSSDAEFEHSITDGSTVITFRSGHLFALAETKTFRDFYGAAVTAGVPTITNLTLTSGDATAPFEKGATLLPVVAARTDAVLGMLLVGDRSTAVAPAFDLITVGDGTSNVRVAGLEAPPQLLRRGASRTLAVLQTKAGAIVVLVPDVPTQPMRPVLRAPRGIALRGASMRADGDEIALIASAGPGFETVVAVDLRTGVVRQLAPAGTAGLTTAFSSQGRVLFAWLPGPAGSTSGSKAFTVFAEDPPASGQVRPLTKVAAGVRFLNR
jgi:hypothetical protein